MTDVMKEFDDIFNNENKKYATFVVSDFKDLNDDDVKSVLSALYYLLKAGYTLRLGANAPYKDTPILPLVKKFKSVEYYQPWKNFKKDQSLVPTLESPTKEAYAKLKDYYKEPDKFSEFSKMFRAAEMHNIYGANMKSKSDVIVVWTPTGYEPKEDEKWAKVDYAVDGVASFAIRAAKQEGIPLFNVKNEESLKRLARYLNVDEKGE